MANESLVPPFHLIETVQTTWFHVCPADHFSRSGLFLAEQYCLCPPECTAITPFCLDGQNFLRGILQSSWVNRRTWQALASFFLSSSNLSSNFRSEQVGHFETEPLGNRAVSTNLFTLDQRPDPTRRLKGLSRVLSWKFCGFTGSYDSRETLEDRLVRFLVISFAMGEFYNR